MASAASSLRLVLLTAMTVAGASCGEAESEKLAVIQDVDPASAPDVSDGAATSPQVADELLANGADVFAKACAVCHGETGDGNGIAKFDKPARSFVDGGFSFGNTPEALYRTVSSGIGGTPMPGFKETLTEQERRAVVDFVIGLGPEQVAVAPGSTVMTVTDKPLVVRGSFPPLREGDEMTPRGLLVGGLDGLSFQYDLDDMRLIAVRQGDFVKRRDWENRGGDTLEPLGEVVFVPDEVMGGPQAYVLDFDVEASASDLGPNAIRARFKASEVQADRVLLEYEVHSALKQLGSVKEHAEALSLGGWTGYRRTFEIVGDKPTAISMFLAGGGGFDELPDLGGPELTVRLSTDELGYGTIWISRGKPKQIRTSLVTDPKPVTWTHDILYGLKPTAANLAALKEAL